jgi:hypothetical protein
MIGYSNWRPRDALIVDERPVRAAEVFEDVPDILVIRTRFMRVTPSAAIRLFL